MTTDELLALVRQAVRAELGEARRPTAVTLTEAARLLAVSPRHVSRMARRGALLVVDIGGARRIPMSEVERLTRATQTEERPKVRRRPAGVPESERLKAMLAKR